MATATNQGKLIRYKAHIGKRVQVKDLGEGVLRFVGVTKQSGIKHKAGVHLDLPHGKHDGLSYFKCPPMHGVLVWLNEVELLSHPHSTAEKLSTRKSRTPISSTETDLRRKVAPKGTGSASKVNRVDAKLKSPSGPKLTGQKAAFSSTTNRVAGSKVKEVSSLRANQIDSPSKSSGPSRPTTRLAGQNAAFAPKRANAPRQKQAVPSLGTGVRRKSKRPVRVKPKTTSVSKDYEEQSIDPIAYENIARDESLQEDVDNLSKPNPQPDQIPATVRPTKNIYENTSNDIANTAVETDCLHDFTNARGRRESQYENVETDESNIAAEDDCLHKFTEAIEKIESQPKNCSEDLDTKLYDQVEIIPATAPPNQYHYENVKKEIQNIAPDTSDYANSESTGDHLVTLDADKFVTTRDISSPVTKIDTNTVKKDESSRNQQTKDAIYDEVEIIPRPAPSFEHHEENILNDDKSVEASEDVMNSSKRRDSVYENMLQAKSATANDESEHSESMRLGLNYEIILECERSSLPPEGVDSFNGDALTHFDHKSSKGSESTYENVADDTNINAKLAVSGRTFVPQNQYTENEELSTVYTNISASSSRVTSDEPEASQYDTMIHEHSQIEELSTIYTNTSASSSRVTSDEPEASQYDTMIHEPCQIEGLSTVYTNISASSNRVASDEPKASQHDTIHIHANGEKSDSVHSNIPDALSSSIASTDPDTEQCSMERSKDVGGTTRMRTYVNIPSDLDSGDEVYEDVEVPTSRRHSSYSNNETNLHTITPPTPSYRPAESSRGASIESHQQMALVRTYDPNPEDAIEMEDDIYEAVDVSLVRGVSPGSTSQRSEPQSSPTPKADHDGVKEKSKRKSLFGFLSTQQVQQESAKGWVQAIFDFTTDDGTPIVRGDWLQKTGNGPSNSQVNVTLAKKGVNFCGSLPTSNVQSIDPTLLKAGEAKLKKGKMRKIELYQVRLDIHKLRQNTEPDGEVRLKLSITLSDIIRVQPVQITSFLVVYEDRGSKKEEFQVANRILRNEWIDAIKKAVLFMNNAIENRYDTVPHFPTKSRSISIDMGSAGETVIDGNDIGPPLPQRNRQINLEDDLDNYETIDTVLARRSSAILQPTEYQPTVENSGDDMYEVVPERPASMALYGGGRNQFSLLDLHADSST